jgi:hypothetical protein
MKLRPHQEKAFPQVMDRLERLGLALLAGQTRSGKTAVALSCAKSLGGPWLFVTKKSAISSIQGDARAIWGNDDHGGVIVNKEGLHKVEPPPGGWGLVIGDESHVYSALPKEPLVRKKMKAITGNAPVLVMSGTPAIEGTAKLYGQMTLGRRGPWSKWKTFYEWWHQPGHYKKKPSGGYGTPGAFKDTGGRVNKWGPTPDYTAVDEERILREVEPYVVRMTREEANYRIVDAKLIPIWLENPAIAGLIRRLKRDRCCDELDILLDKGPAQLLQAVHMLAGGTYKAYGEARRLPEEFDPYYRARWIAEGMLPGKTYVVLTAYIEERPLVAEYLDATGHTVAETLEELREMSEGVFVGSLASLAEGVDLSWITGTQILYSLTFSGAKFSQVVDRQLNFNRTEAARVAIPLLRGGIDGDVLEAVRNKVDFNGRIYEQ